METSCGAGTVQECDRAALAAIDKARAYEGLGPLELPRRFSSLSPVAQLVAVANRERASRGLPALHGPQALFDDMAWKGAQRRQDPAGPRGTTWASNLAAGVRTPLQADYEWMYDDGPGGSNASCERNGRGDCWGHRRNILSPWNGSIGAATLGSQGQHVFAELIVEGH